MGRLTRRSLRAMEAVRDGKVVRRYTDRSNRFIVPGGVGQKTLLDLERNRLIRETRDESGAPGVAYIDVRMGLTDAGRRSLDADSEGRNVK